MAPLLPPQLAKLGLDLISKAPVNADDVSLATATQVRAFLRAVVEGKLVVGRPVPEGTQEQPQ